MAVTFPQVRVGEPLHFKTLSVFPLFTEPKGSVEYVLAGEAIRDQLLTVQEVSEGGSVPELLVENKGDLRVLFIEGEELSSGKTESNPEYVDSGWCQNQDEDSGELR